MSQIGEHEALNDDPLSDEVLDEGELLKDSGEDKNMAAEPGTSGANVSLSAADFKSLSLAILNVSKRLDKLEEKPSTTGKGPGKRPSQEHQNAVPAKECSSSSSEQNTSNNEDVKTLMAKLPAMLTISVTGTKMKRLQNYRKSTSLKTLSGRTFKTHNLPSSLARCFAIVCQTKSLKRSSSDKLDRKTVKL